MCLDFSLFSDRACAAWASLMYVVNLEMDNSPKMGFFQHSKWSDNKGCTVEVGLGIFIECWLYFIPKSGRRNGLLAVVNIPIQSFIISP